MTLKSYENIEKVLNRMDIIGSKIKLIQKITPKKIIFSRKKYTIDEIEFTFGDKVQFWVSYKNTCTTINFEEMILTMLLNKFFDEYLGIKKLTRKYILEYLQIEKYDKQKLLRIKKEMI